LEIHRIERDDELIVRLIELEQDFWNYVQRDTPPPTDGSESAEQALRCLNPEDNGNTRDFSQAPILCAAFDELKEVRATLEDHSKREAEFKQFLQQAMGESSRTVFANGSVPWRRAKASVV
jgi:predicted phage-related endonuclease